MSEKTKTISLFQDEKTGKLVEFIHKHDEDYAKVKDTSGVISYVPLDHLVPYDKEKGRLAKVTAPHAMPVPMFLSFSYLLIGLMSLISLSLVAFLITQEVVQLVIFNSQQLVIAVAIVILS